MDKSKIQVLLAQQITLLKKKAFHNRGLGLIAQKIIFTMTTVHRL